MHMTRARLAIKAPAPMGLLRTLAAAHGRRLLSLVLTALAMQALMPAGLMIAPVAGHGAQITLCPQTHPLARAAAEQASDAQADMAALHAAMGHAMPPHGFVDHAAMGHGPAAPDDDAPASGAGSPAQSCAFAGAGALAALSSDDVARITARQAEPPAPALLLSPLRLAAPPHLRPPLRAPPALI